MEIRKKKSLIPQKYVQKIIAYKANSRNNLRWKIYQGKKSPIPECRGNNPITHLNMRFNLLSK